MSFYTEIEEVAAMLGSSAGNLKGALTQRTVEVKKEKVKTDFSVAGVRLWKSCSANSMLFSLYSDLKQIYIGHVLKGELMHLQRVSNKVILLSMCRLIYVETLISVIFQCLKGQFYSMI